MHLLVYISNYSHQPVNFVAVDLSEDEASIKGDVRLAIFDGGQRRGTASFEITAVFLWGGVMCLPSVITFRKVRAFKPRLVPHMEVPEHNQQ